MYLPPSGAEQYTVKIVTTPVLNDWEVSFDGGTTWIAGAQDGTDPTIWRWPVRGPLNTKVGFTPIPTDLQPLLRSLGSEDLVRKGPYIALTTPGAV